MKVFVIAGEPSGDKLGGALIPGLKHQRSDLEFAGVGGANMAAQGVPSLFDMADLSVMGLLEVLPRIPTLLRRIKQTVAAAIAFQPDVLITIDSPDFCLRVAAKLRDAMPDLKVVHYVAPSVWAWRPERAEKMARHVDHVLALLPFEPPFMEAAGMSCDFVGHPVAAEKVPTQDEVASLRAALSLGTGPVVCLLPGSRKGEVSRLGPIYGEVAGRILQKVENVQFILPVSPSVSSFVQNLVKDWRVPVTLIEAQSGDVSKFEHRKQVAFAMSDAALATSGTVALELAAVGCPMVVGYKANYLTTRMVKKLAQIDTANLINIVTASRVIPEFLFENCTADQITPAVLDVLANPETQKAACAEAMAQMGAGGEEPGLRAAKSVLRFIA